MNNLPLIPDEDFLPSPLEVFRISSVHMRVEEGDHSLWAGSRSAIEANWEGEVAANPALFNGQTLLQERVGIAGDALVSSGRMTSYSTLLWWRKQVDRQKIRLLFGAAVPVSVDGSIIVIRMAPHTANAGRVCFAAGSLDASDIDGNLCDVTGSMVRELQEETGLDVKDAMADPQLFAAHSNGRCIVFRSFYFPWSADEVRQRIEVHMNKEALSEIDDVYVLQPHSWSALAPLMDDLTRLVVEAVFAER